MLLFFFFNDTATTEIYTLSLHDALPISEGHRGKRGTQNQAIGRSRGGLSTKIVALVDALGNLIDFVLLAGQRDRKSTRLNSSHANISYAVFCLKKKKELLIITTAHPIQQ